MMKLKTNQLKKSSQPGLIRQTRDSGHEIEITA
jgi:hypothetical protein